MRHFVSKKTPAPLLMIGFILILGSCARTRAVKTPIYEDHRTGVVLRGWMDTEQQTPLSFDYAHPAVFTGGELAYLLGSIRYQDKGLLGWSEARRVFSAEELYRITPSLVQAFGQANANEEIFFHLRSAKPGPFFASERFTDGTMFVKGGKLNCIFANVDVRDESDSYGSDPRRYYAGGLWSLVPNGWQKLVEDEGGTHFNWIELDIAQGLAERHRFEKTLKQRTRARRSLQRQPQRRPQENWEDWGTGDQEPPESDEPDVYFPDNAAPKANDAGD